MNFEEWYVPTSQELRKFIIGKDVMNPDIDELLKDYFEFESNCNLRPQLSGLI